MKQFKVGDRSVAHAFFYLKMAFFASIISGMWSVFAFPGQGTVETNSVSFALVTASAMMILAAFVSMGFNVAELLLTSFSRYERLILGPLTVMMVFGIAASFMDQKWASGILMLAGLLGGIAAHVTNKLHDLVQVAAAAKLMKEFLSATSQTIQKELSATMPQGVTLICSTEHDRVKAELAKAQSTIEEQARLIKELSASAGVEVDEQTNQRKE